ncbi:MAG: winged helix-turn-helix domain-containing protein [Rhizobiaceae bacterium]|nr:winged helix-turn-helix domain-containing protein [Rhizobiaceae bacterium]
MAECPCCGQGLPDDGEVRIDLDGGFVVANGAVARLTEGEFNLFLLLWQRRPRMLSRDQLMAEAYWLRADDEEPEIKIIDVLICKARKKLGPTGIAIDTVWGRGYRILPKAEVEA